MPWNPHVRALLLLAAASVFLFFLGSGQAYRSDEVWSLRTVSLPYAGMMEEIRNDVHPPLYYWLLAGWVGLVGTGEVAVRLLSVLLCLGAAVAMYFAGREWFGVRGGVLAAVLFVCSPLTWIATQNARMYGLLALASAVSTMGFLRLSRRERVGARDWAVFVAANIVGSFTHIWFFFLLFAQGCAHLAVWRGRRVVRVGAAMALSLAPYGVLWLPVLLRQIRRTDAALAWVPTPGAMDLLQTGAFLGGAFLVFAPFLRGWWKSAPLAEAALPALVAVLAVLVPFAISFWKPLFWPRFTIVALPAFCLAVAAFAPMASRFRVETGVLGSSCVLALILSFYVPLCDSRRTAEYLARSTKPGDVVIFTSLSRMPIDYYWNQMQPHREVVERSFPAEIDSHPGFEGAIHTAEAKARLSDEAVGLTEELRQRENGRVFLLHGFWPETDAVVKGVLDREFPAVQQLGMQCEAMGSYFRFVSAYSCGPYRAAR